MAEPQVTPELKTEILSLQKQLLDTVEKYAKQTQALEGKMETTVKDTVDKLNARLDELEVKAFRPVKHVGEQLVKDFNPQRKEAYDGFLRKGSVAPEHLKLLTEADAQGGGFFIVPEYVQDIIKAVILISPIRQYAKIRTTSSNSVKYPKRTGTFAAQWTNEVQQQTEATGLKYGLEDIPNHAMTALSDISMEDLEDNMFDMAAQLNDEFSEQFAKAEGAAFVGGSGKGQPEGFMTNASIAFDKTGVASALSPQGDEFTNCLYNMKSVYAKEATWFLNRQTIGAVRLLKDTQNRPLWLPFADSGLASGAGPTIIGAPYAEIPDMPNIGAGTFPVALGAWKRAYVIVDRIAINVMRDNLTQASKGVVRFLARKRVGGQLVLSEAVRKIKVSQ